MSVSRATLRGVTFYDSLRSYNGVTLFTPKLGKGAWLIDMLGRLVNYWETLYQPACDAQLLPNGNLLYMGKVSNGPLGDLEGAGGILLELDWDNKLVWRYEDPYLHHTFCRIGNGNTIVVKWVKVPDAIAARVRGGISGTEKNGVMWGDALQEVTPSGEVVWEWIAYEHLDTKVDIICPLCPHDTWPHTNACVELPDGDILTSFMKTNTIAIIDKKTGDVKWRWGASELAHQHSAAMLDNGNILVFDNGLHAYGFPAGLSRVLEINLTTNKMVWAYEAGQAATQFYSSTMGNCQRLPNGNTLICESTTGRIFEVNSKQELLWQFVNDLPAYEPSPVKAKSCMVCSAYRYGHDYPGLRGATARERRETAYRVRGDEAIRSRLELLGY